MKSRIFLKVTIFMVNMFLIFFNSNLVKAGWEIKQVDNCGEYSFYFSSLALDSADNPHISYCDFSQFSPSHPYNDLTHAFSYDEGSSWSIEEALDSNGLSSSLALDSADNPHISYSDAVGFLKHTFFYEGSWYPLITGMAPGPNVGTTISLALDSNDNPHISYQSMPSLYYAYYNPGAGGWIWDMPSLFPAVIDGHFCSLALDSNDNPHISHSDSNFDLKHTFYNGSSWVHELVANSGSGGSLAMDSVDNPQISYVDTTTNALKYASYNGSSWDIETVAASGDLNTCSLALDSNDNPHISCQDSNGNIRYFHYNGSSWEIETVDASGNALSSQISLALDSNDSPHVTYHHSNGDLKYAQQCPEEDFDCDNVLNVEDNCSNDYNPNQEDQYPPGGNGIGDACDCESDFNCDGNVDADDIGDFLIDYGRSIFENPCTNAVPCNGDSNCDGNVDAEDIPILLDDYGRSPFLNPCPACVVGNWCVYD